MSTILDVHNAARALLPSGITHYLGQAPQSPAPPWLVSSFDAPDITTSEAAQGISKTGTLTVTIATLTEDSTNWWADAVDDALVGAFVTLPGWSIGALVPGDRVGPYPAGLTAVDTNLKYQVARLRYRFTYSRTA